MAPAIRKVVLTDRGLQSLKPAPAGKRYAVWDAATPNLCVRVTDRGIKSFVVVASMMGKQGFLFTLDGTRPITDEARDRFLSFPAKRSHRRLAAMDRLTCASSGMSRKTE